MSEPAKDSQGLLKALYPEGVAGLDSEIRYLGSNLRETLAHYRLLYPELVSYRGGLFIEHLFDKALVDDLFDQSAFDAGEDAVAVAEQHINAIDLRYEDDEFDLGMARGVAEAIAWVWPRWIRETYGVEVEVIFSVTDAEDCQIWFQSKRPLEGM